MDQTDAHRHYIIVEKALHYLQQHQQHQPALAEVADYCGVSEYHFQRVFSAWAGTSPKRFLKYLTREQCRSRLLQGKSLLHSSIDVGLSGSSRLHDLWVTLEAVTPGEEKSGGKALELFYGLHTSPFGHCFIVTTSRGVHQLEFIAPEKLDTYVDQLHIRWPAATIMQHQQNTQPYIGKIFSSRPTDLNPPTEALKLWLKASPFQLKVWEALLKVPPGHLCSYQDLAELIGQPGAARAIGSAVARNPVAILIPCHRVIRNMGVIGEYRWGKTRKQALLGFEANQYSDDSFNGDEEA